jgi:hypothetical protein
MFSIYYIPLLKELDSISIVLTINISLLTELISSRFMQAFLLAIRVGFSIISLAASPVPTPVYAVGL